MRTFALAVVVLAVGASAAAGTRQPSLRLVDESPLTVQGARFGSSELVRLTVKEDAVVLAQRRLRSGPRGGFVARFRAVELHRCSGGVTVTARAASGRMAVAKLPQPACPPPLDPP